MKQIILGIHGLGNKPSKSILEKWWLKSIKEGLDRIDKERLTIPFELVYWADVIHPEPYDLNITDKENPLFIEEVYTKGNSEPRVHKATLKSKILRYIEEQLDRVFLNEDLSINFKNVSDKLIHHYFSELETYYDEDCNSLTDPKCNAKNEIQKRLKEVLNKYKDYQILLIAHSMGSIVAFDVLTENSKIKVDTLVTIGSPLGIPVIVSKIFAEQKQKNKNLKKPTVPDTIVSKWVNMSDMEDKVALDHTLNDDFNSNKFGLRAEDLTVVNDYEINNEPNPHKSFGYLRTPEMANVIHQFLRTTKKDSIYQGYKFITDKIKVGLGSVKNGFHRRR